MGRPPISVPVSSTQDSRFVRPLGFYSIRRLSEDTEISLRAARNAYQSGRTSIRKASGEVYSLEWGKPVAPIDTSKCYYCLRDLTVKGRSTWFHMERKNIKQAPMGPQDPGPLWGPMTFTSLYAASKVTGISNNTLRNACNKNNEKITRRKGVFARYKIESNNICRQCDPSTPRKSRDVVESYVMPIWRWDENNHMII